jgi:hypothetical protein
MAKRWATVMAWWWRLPIRTVAPRRTPTDSATATATATATA